MSNSSTATATASLGFPVFTLATLVLLVLKVAGLSGASWGLANLSWWWVFAPLLAGFALSLIFLLIVFVVVVCVAIFNR